MTNLYITAQGGDLGYLLKELEKGNDKSMKNLKMTENNVKFYASQIALAIHHLHSLGILYRDIKPQNVLLDTSGYCKISDFGIVKFIENGEKVIGGAGTPGYRSPEVELGKKYSYDCDWWSFGVTLYFMVMGKLPKLNKKNNYDLEDHEHPSGFVKDFSGSKGKDFKKTKKMIKGLLKRKVKKRLGTKKGGAASVFQHNFFKKFDFEAILKKQTKAPW